MQAQGKQVIVKRQYKDQVWREVISLQEYKQWEQTHALQKGTERETLISREKQLHP